MKEMLEKHKIKFEASTAYRHQGNASAENKAKTAKKLLHAKLKEGDEWMEALRLTENICNQVIVNDSTGYTPI